MPATVSVVVVSRGRPEALARCLTGLAQLYHPAFEVIVVCDPAGAAAVALHPLGSDVRMVPFDVPNISAARNAGVEEAGGEVVAFIDDDAVPEPSWLDHLVAPFVDGSVAVSSGFVIGRNGISFQWRARSVDETGVATSLSVEGTAPLTPTAPPAGAIKTEGTNMAVRRSALLELGGFDPAFAFYLDETDLNMRIARAGLGTTLVPLAQVHHGFAASARRRGDRTPLSLFDIGASSAVFWRKHTDPARHATARAALVKAERARLVRLLVGGLIEPRDQRRLMTSLHHGLEEGALRPLSDHALSDRATPHRAIAPGARPTCASLLGGGARDTADLAKQAMVLRAENRVVTVIALSFGARYHRHRFDPSGIWWQTGGVFGRSLRTAPLVQPSRLAHRIDREAERLAPVRAPQGFLRHQP